MFSWAVASCLSPGARGAAHCPPPHQSPRGTDRGYTPCYLNMLIVWSEVIFLFVVQCLCTWGCLSASKISKLRAVCRSEQLFLLSSLPSPSRHYCSTHTTIKMVSAMSETVIRKQTTQGCYNRSVAGSEFHFASRRHWGLRKPVKGIFRSHTSAPLCSLARGQLLTDNMHSLMCP